MNYWEQVEEKIRAVRRELAQQQEPYRIAEQAAIDKGKSLAHIADKLNLFALAQPTRPCAKESDPWPSLEALLDWVLAYADGMRAALELFADGNNWWGGEFGHEWVPETDKREPWEVVWDALHPEPAKVDSDPCGHTTPAGEARCNRRNEKDACRGEG